MDGWDGVGPADGGQIEILQVVLDHVMFIYRVMARVNCSV